MKKHLENLNDYLEVTVIITADCHFCNEQIEMHNHTINEVAAISADEGWREVNSQKFNCIALACPDCSNQAEKTE